MYSIHKVTNEAIFIIDNDIGKSVTNDAENVVARLYNEYGNKFIFYRDTCGHWDELVHDNGVFTRFSFGTRNYEPYM